MAVSPLGISEEGHRTSGSAVAPPVLLARRARAGGDRADRGRDDPPVAPAPSVQRRGARRHVDSTNQLAPHESKVFGSNIPAKAYGTQIAARRTRASTRTGSWPPTSRRSRRPRSTGRSPPTARTRSGGRPRSRPTCRRCAQRWRAARGARPSALGSAWSDYLHLGAVYGLLPGTLDAQIDGMPHMLPGDSGRVRASRGCTGSSTGCGPARRRRRWCRWRRRCSATRWRSAGCCRRCRSRRSTTPRAPTRSSRTPSATCSAAWTCSGAAPACWGPRLGWPPPRR